MRAGRKPRSTRDAVFGMVLRVFCRFSDRRFTGGRKAARRAGDGSRPLQGAEVNPFIGNRPACAGAAGAAVRRRIVPVKATAPAVSAPAAGRSRCGPGECLTGRLRRVKVQHPAPQGAGAAASVADMAVRPLHPRRACRRRATGPGSRPRAAWGPRQ
jgi:hypothetical protein